ncbi:MAG: prepilin peptidase [Planctomycetota bacterium]
MERFELLMLLYQGAMVLWAAAFGGCVGSLINVLAYRMPLGLSVVSPPSRCPKCDTKLAWNDNVPVLGWLWLKGKCRYCKDPISFEYPAVELFVAMLFALLYTLWYVVPEDASLLGIAIGEIRPEWATNDIGKVWPGDTFPEFLVLLALFGSLVAMTIIDARTYTIPLVLAWVPTVVGIVVHTGHAAYLELIADDLWRSRAVFQSWAIATPWTDAGRGGPSAQLGWWWIGASLGGAVGVGLSAFLLRLGALKHSFADYEEWEAKAIAEAKAAIPAPDAEGGGDGGDDLASDPHLWIQYPHARREMFREIAYLAPIIALGSAGGWLAHRLAGPWSYDPGLLDTIPAVGAAPLWLTVLSGTLMGYLIGGGVIWAVRILGSLAAGKEAMGLGDVHLLAAIGACLGWIDAVLTFFVACFVGAIWGVAAIPLKGKLARALPFGPYLAVGALVVVLGKPLVEQGLTLLLRSEMPIDLP